MSHEHIWVEIDEVNESELSANLVAGPDVDPAHKLPLFIQEELAEVTNHFVNLGNTQRNREELRFAMQSVLDRHFEQGNLEYVQGVGFLQAHSPKGVVVAAVTVKNEVQPSRPEDYYKRVYDNDNPEGDAHGWIQWKGTDVCVDLHCKCGAHLHFDGDFFYSFTCGECGQVYATGQNIKLIPIDDEDLKAYTTASSCHRVLRDDHNDGG